ncbi:hypothetical protein DVH07_06555 [Hafnia paralvei]|uniref:DUF6246 family protein n=1 Tax=Hafnia paralvei TaxID=546367 RepID=UPI000DF1CF49|nr:DUF6246 family protein [Hafnia paralvei]RDA68356.1 hypothetical protein DU449_07865 [Hafnia paralvei]RDA69395.1 hypothetical protein DVH09_08460 [Hafnia paralvei]RDA69556.1 hypothetical protein DVH08_09455 [Hafnia paralvei]RDA79599.1 hypothetical protein DVH10_06845 [Hafnia paralvei]RDA80136.1 hypothetical protein DVH07_06555 [Hafnia paralvei]
MKPLTAIGEMRFSEAAEGGRDYFFKPSFEAMAAIGEPDEIVKIFSIVHGSKIQELMETLAKLPPNIPHNTLAALFLRPSDELLTAAMHVMKCCYQGDDDLSSLIGEWKGWSNCVVYRPGAIVKSDIILIAQQLMQHGVIGKANVRRLQRNETNEYSKEFKVIDYIIAARNHLGMSREEAANLTMTEFTLLIADKYPNQKGLTKDEYDQVADEYLRKKQAKLAAVKQH